MLWGCHNICPSLSHFQVTEVTWPELSALSHAGVWGDIQKPQCNIAFLLIVLGKTVEGEMAFRLVVVWMHPHQACLPSLDEVSRKLTLLIDIGDNWAYAFVWLNKGALHVTPSNKGHISTMIDWVPSRSACRHLYQLGVHKLLQCGDQIVCPEGLNGGFEPVVLSLPKPPLCNMSIPSRPTHRRHYPKETNISGPGCSPPTGAGDTCGPEKPVLATPKPVTTSQQASPQADMFDNTVPSSHLSSPTLASETPKAASVPTTPSKTPSEADTGTLSDKVL